MSEENPKDAGKVGLKTILKGNAAKIYTASSAGFQVANFQVNPSSSKDSQEAMLKNEIAALQSQIAMLKGNLENSEKKAEQNAKNSYSKGFEEGKVQGVAEGKKKSEEEWKVELEALRQETLQSLESFERQVESKFIELRDFSSEIAIAIAKRIFCEEAAVNPNLIPKVIKEAFIFLGQEEKMRVRLNPLDVAIAENTESFWKPISASLKVVELVSDEKIERGGCIIEAENGSSIEMEKEEILERISESVKGIYAMNQSSQTPAQSV